MKIKTNFLLAAITITISWSSCTMEKRQYMPGYYVDIKNKMKLVRESHAVSSRFQDSEYSSTGDKSQLTASLSDSIELIVKTNQPTYYNLPIEEKLAPPKKNELSKKTIFIKKIEKDDPGKKKTGDRRPHWASIIGLMSGIAGSIDFVSLFYLIIQSTGGALLVYGVGIALGVISIVFSSIGLRNTNKHPDKYSLPGIAITGLVTGIITLLFFLGIGTIAISL